MSKLHLNPEFDVAGFLRNHWQVSPVLLPQLVPEFQDLIDPSELAGLACEEFIESRLITEFKPGRWQVQHGPFAESDFTKLPHDHWTVLVQAVDQWLDEVAALRSLFEFVPRWRIADVMISHATDAGGVGPHFDNYDVFLLQGVGQRRWQTGGKVPADCSLDNQDGVGILPTFNPEQEFILTPGDALYIPPQFAHWGRSLGDSTCYSIGFRAPSLGDMFEGFSDLLIANCLSSQRFTDTRVEPADLPARIDPESVTENFQRLRAAFDHPARFAQWFGCWVTVPKYPELRQLPKRKFTLAKLRSASAAGQRLRHSNHSRFAFLPATTELCSQLFVDGEVLQLPASCCDVIPELCEPTPLNNINFSQLPDSSPVLTLLLQLLNQGSLQLR